MDVFDKAITFAVHAHEGQLRKNGGIYIVHPLKTAAIAASMTDDREVLAAAVLHDTVEDTDVEADDILREFGQRVAYLVASETEDKRRDLPPDATWRVRKSESLEILRNTDDINIKIIWLSDKLSNMRSFWAGYRKHGASLWRNFNQKDPSQQHWYYSTVAELVTDLADTAAWVEYSGLINKVFSADGGKQ